MIRVEDHKAAMLISAALFVGLLSGWLAFYGSMNAPYDVTYNRADMAPTIEPNQEVTVEPVEFADIQRDDLIYFETDNMGAFIKRVIGVPGDTVYIELGDLHVHLDDFNLYEPYPGQWVSDEDGEYEVGLYKLFVSGDNLQEGASIDSKNSLGLVSREKILGRVEL